MADESARQAVQFRDRQCTEPLAERPPTGEERVFPVGPRADRYFASEAAERARTALVRCVERMDGPALLIGASGTGKSLMLAVLAESFRFRLSVAPLPGGQLRTARELHQGILYALGLPFRGLDEGELRFALIQRLEAEDESQGGVLLLVDEAQSLSVEVIEELRMLTNVVREGVSQVRLVMAGTPILEELLTDPLLESFQQRIAVRCYLPAMSRAETSAYIQGHLSAAQRDVKLIAPDAVDEVYEVSEGLPRVVNQLCDHALGLAESAGRESIDAALVREAWSELQQFPTAPTSSTAHAQPDESSQEDVIEFGALQDSREGSTAEFDDGFGIVHGEPAERIDAITEQLESLREAESAQGQGGPPVSDLSDVDFSLPEDKWPEVEVVVRDAPPPLIAAGEYREEEVLSDPFHVPAGQRSGWSIHTDAYPGGTGRGPVRVAVEASAFDADLEPLSSVPLMMQVQTELYSPDPVLPEEQAIEVAVALPADLHSEVDTSTQGPLSGPLGKHHRHDPSQPGDPSSKVPRRLAPRPAKKKFATLFSSLQG